MEFSTTIVEEILGLLHSCIIELIGFRYWKQVKYMSDCFYKKRRFMLLPHTLSELFLTRGILLCYRYCIFRKNWFVSLTFRRTLSWLCWFCCTASKPYFYRDILQNLKIYKYKKLSLHRFVRCWMPQSPI